MERVLRVEPDRDAHYRRPRDDFDRQFDEKHKHGYFKRYRKQRAKKIRQQYGLDADDDDVRVDVCPPYTESELDRLHELGNIAGHNLEHLRIAHGYDVLRHAGIDQPIVVNAPIITEVIRQTAPGSAQSVCDRRRRWFSHYAYLRRLRLVRSPTPITSSGPMISGTEILSRTFGDARTDGSTHGTRIRSPMTMPATETQCSESGDMALTIVTTNYLSTKPTLISDVLSVSKENY